VRFATGSQAGDNVENGANNKTRRNKPGNRRNIFFGERLAHKTRPVRKRVMVTNRIHSLPTCATPVLRAPAGGTFSIQLVRE
jgi:hypothetical protein